jgi:hypothetical protein
VAKLVSAPRSGRGGSNSLGVQVSPAAQLTKEFSGGNVGTNNIYIMKKVYWFFAFLLTGMFADAQLTPSCSMDDWNLLEAHPPEINRFDAADAILNRKLNIPYQSGGYYAAYAKEKDYFSFARLDISIKKEMFFLKSTTTPGKRVWAKSKPYFFHSHTQLNWYFYGFCIGTFLLGFLGFSIISALKREIYRNGKDIKYQWAHKSLRKTILRNVVWFSVILGIVSYLLYLAIFVSNTEEKTILPFQPLEPIVLILGTVISAFLYLGILTVVYWIKEKMRKQRPKNMVLS